MSTDTWDSGFQDKEPFASLAFALDPWLKRDDWPEVPDYQALFERHSYPITVGDGQPIRCVTQDPKTKDFTRSYVARIHKHGEIQTRLQNWHDFFQAFSWTLFPRAKAALIERHYFAALQRHRTQSKFNARSAEENLLSLWDEGGVLLLSDQQALLEAIQQFNWNDVFVHYRQDLNKHLRVLVFGHALFEKLRRPYLGLTGNGILLRTPDNWMTMSVQQLLHASDSCLCQILSNHQNSSPLQKAADLQPFPILGLPGYWSDNQPNGFYENRQYFRSGRRDGRLSKIIEVTAQG